jgi:chlorophyll synthase
LLGKVAIAGLAVACLNGGSNALNQLCDEEIDRVNKPGRPLPSRALSRSAAWAVTASLFGVTVGLAWFVGPPAWDSPGGMPEFFGLLGAVAIAALVYSVPPFRTKRWAWPAQTTIALARGLLLPVCGWSCVACVWTTPEPWLIGLVLFLFLLGASATKDFSDVRGDALAGCRTLPVVLGPVGAGRVIGPFFVVPWLLLALLAWVSIGRSRPLLHGRLGVIATLGIVLAIVGGRVAVGLLRVRWDPPGHEGNHPSWVWMYRMMMAAWVGMAVASIG